MRRSSQRLKRKAGAEPSRNATAVGTRTEAFSSEQEYAPSLVVSVMAKLRGRPGNAAKRAYGLLDACQTTSRENQIPLRALAHAAVAVLKGDDFDAAAQLACEMWLAGLEEAKRRRWRRYRNNVRESLQRAGRPLHKFEASVKRITKEGRRDRALPKFRLFLYELCGGKDPKWKY